jgi:hypothetical protein
MPFKMECRRFVWWKYQNSPEDVRKGFDKAVDEIVKDWMRGSADLKEPGASLNLRRYRFEYGVLTYRYTYDVSDASTHIRIIDWKDAEGI